MRLPNTIQESSDEAVGYTPATQSCIHSSQEILGHLHHICPSHQLFSRKQSRKLRRILIYVYVGIYVGPQDNPCPFINLPPLGISCLSFRGSSSLFSIVCSLFWQNTWAWVSLRRPGAFCLPWYSACIDRGQYRFEAVQTRGKGTFSSSSFLLPCRPAHFPRRRRSLSWTLSRTIFGATCASLNVTV